MEFDGIVWVLMLFGWDIIRLDMIRWCRMGCIVGLEWIRWDQVGLNGIRREQMGSDGIYGIGGHPRGLDWIGWAKEIWMELSNNLTFFSTFLQTFSNSSQNIFHFFPVFSNYLGWAWIGWLNILQYYATRWVGPLQRPPSNYWWGLVAFSHLEWSFGPSN